MQRGKHFILLNIKQVKYEFLKEISSKKSNQWIKFSFNIDALWPSKILRHKITYGKCLNHNTLRTDYIYSVKKWLKSSTQM